MKLFHYLLAENLITGVYLPGIAWDKPNWGISSLGLPSGNWLEGWTSAELNLSHLGSFTISKSTHEAIERAKTELQAPSKDHINGIEVSEIITKPPAGAAPLPGAPSRGPCSRYCSPTEYRSMDTNDGTGDHEEF